MFNVNCYVFNMIWNCSVCNIKIDKNDYLKYRTVCKSCYNKKRKKNNDNSTIQYGISRSHQQPKNDEINKNNVNNTIVSANKNHAHIAIGPRDVAKTYYMLKTLEKIGNKRPTHIITWSPNQYPNYKTSTEYKPIGK